MNLPSFLSCLWCLSWFILLAAPVHGQRAYDIEAPALDRGIAGKALVITGESVPYQSGDLFLVDTLNGASELLAGGTKVFGATFSPDGKAAAYVQDGVIKVMDLDSREVRELGRGAGALSWTRDGFLYYAASERGSHIYRRIRADGTGEPGNVFEKGGPALVNIDVSRDGRHGVWTQGTWSVWHVDLTTQAVQQVGWGCNGAISPDGRIGAVLEGSHHRLRLHDLRTMDVFDHIQTASLRPDGRPEQIAGTRFSVHDPRFLLYTSENYLKGFIYDIDRGVAHYVADGMVWDFLPEKAPAFNPTFPLRPETVTMDLRGNQVRLAPPGAADARPDPRLVDLAVAGEAAIGGDGTITLSGGGLTSMELGRFLRTTARENRFALSFDARITPADTELEGEHFVLGFQAGAEPASWGIWQVGDRLVWKNRNHAESYGPEQTLARTRAGEPVHVMLAFMANGVRAYVQGRWVVAAVPHSGIGRWVEQPFVFGNVGQKDAGAWRGTVSHVTAYAEAVGREVASAHAQALRADRPEGPFVEGPIQELVQIRGHLAGEAGSWPVIQDGLGFAFRRADAPVTAFRPDGRPLAAATVQPVGMGRIDPDQSLRISHGGFVVEGAAKHIVQAAAEARALTLRFWIAPDQVSEGPVPLITLGPGLRVEQRGTTAWIVTPGQPDGVEICRLSALYGTNFSGIPVEVAVTWEGDRLILYKDGRYLTALEASAGFGEWEGTDVRLGSPDAESEGFVGRMDVMAMYARALKAEEIRSEYQAHLAREMARLPRETWLVRARLVAASEPRNLDDIAPYTRSLVVHEYKVEQVRSGDRSLNGKTIRVAHWAHMDRQELPVLSARQDQVYEIRIERMDDHPQLAAQAIGDTLGEDLDIPLFHDVAPPGRPLRPIAD